MSDFQNLNPAFALNNEVLPMVALQSCNETRPIA